jgi:DNA-binding NarL/FixJ family response regulator
VPGKVIVVGFEPILRDLLAEELRDEFEVVAVPHNLDEALDAIRTVVADVVLFDGDLPTGNPDEIVTKLSLAGAAPIVVLSSQAFPGEPGTTALLMAGARAVIHKNAGPLPLDLGEAWGRTLAAQISQVAAS